MKQKINSTGAENKRVLDELFSIIDKPTLKRVSQLTEIQMTRLFRILNGSPMKLEEYLIIKKIILSSKGESDIETILDTYVINLSKSAVSDLKKFMKRKIKLSILKSGHHDLRYN